MTASSLSPNGAPSAAVPALWETKPSEQKDGTGCGRPKPWTLRTTFRVYRALISITCVLAVRLKKDGRAGGHVARRGVHTAGSW
jgi:hypothetical protein